MTRNRSRIPAAIITIVMAGLLAVSARGDETSGPAQGGGEYYRSTVLPAVTAVRNAMPPAPEGWIVSGDSEVVPQPAPGDARFLHFSLTRSYRRATGVKDEQQKLDAAFAESSRRHSEEAKPAIDELIRQQTEVSLSLRRAVRRKNAAEEKRLNDELEENGRRMHAVHEEVDRKIGEDVLPFLIRDAEASIAVTVNDETAGLEQGEDFAWSGAAAAQCREGEQAAAGRWREGRCLVLYGSWQRVGEGRFRGTVDRSPQSARAQTIAITLTGEKKRCEELLRRIGLKSILSLMK